MREGHLHAQRGERSATFRPLDTELSPRARILYAFGDAFVPPRPWRWPAALGSDAPS
jgi:hypothetical protein